MSVYGTACQTKDRTLTEPAVASQGFYRRRLRPALIAATLLSIPLILLGFSLLVNDEFADIRELRREVDESIALRSELEKLLSLHQDIETGQRGYMLTGDEAYRRPYDEAIVKVPAAFERFERADMPPRYAPDLARLKAVSRAKIDFASSAIRATAEGRTSEAVAFVRSGRGKETMDEIRAIIGKVDSTEAEHLSRVSQFRDDSRTRLEKTITVLEVLLAIVLAAVAAFTGRTIRERQRAMGRVQDLSERQKAMFDGAVDGMLLLDHDGFIVDANSSIARMFGYDEQGLIGQHNTVLIARAPPLKESQAWLREVGPAGRNGAGRRQEFIGQRADGSTFNTETAISQFHDGGATFYVAVIRDITEYKRIEAMKTEFVSTVSHELRTPLTSIGGSLGLLASGAVGQLGEKAARLVSIAHSNCDRLVRLINDILDIEKMESGSMAFDMRRMQVAPLIQRTMAANTGFAERHDVTLVAHTPPWPQCIVGDPDRLEQLVTNLVSNAIKHSPAGGEVEIWCEQRAGNARIEIRDRGAGVPPGFREKIFGKFAMADTSDSRARGGTGLGLSIAREIAQRHGGTVGFADREGGGTDFFVELPMLQDELVMPRAVPDLPIILHVDDDQDCLSVVDTAFEDKATILSAGSLQQARYILANREVAAVIIDVAMAGENGLDLLADIHAMQNAPPTVLFTAVDDSYSWAEVDAVLIKSKSELSKLVATVFGLIERAGRSDAA